MKSHRVGKTKKEEEASEAAGAPEEEGPDYDELVKRVNAISNPLASKKLTKKIYKVWRSMRRNTSNDGGREAGAQGEGTLSRCEGGRQGSSQGGQGVKRVLQGL